MTPKEFRTAGHKLVDDIAEFMGSLRERPVTVDLEPSDVQKHLPDKLPEEGTDAATLLRDFTPLFFDHSLFNGHPRFYGYITSSAAPIGALADMLAASVNPNLGGWQLSPMASEIEKQSVKWISEMIGFSADGSGVFVSGGNVANFLCFLAARQAKAPVNLRERGIKEAGGQMLVYSTSETHTWIQKATDIFGHGTQAIRSIPLDDELRADVSSLREQIATDRRAGDHPFLIVGTAGTVSTGAIDPLHDLQKIAKENDMWFHVDGAYGAFAAMLPDCPADLRAMGSADSVAVDPHKWLYSPLEAACAIVRDPDALVNAFSYRPPYYHFEQDEEPKINYYEYGLQNSRGFRALKTWLAIRQVGRLGYVRMIEDDIALAKAMYALVDEDPELEAITQGLSITTFRYVPTDLARSGDGVEKYLNDLNEEILVRMKQTAESFLTNAVVGDKFLLRACIVNFRTSLEDVEALPEIVKRHGREADKRIRPTDL